MQSITDLSGWQAARNALLHEEKAITAAQDRLAAKRRRLPWQPVTQDHVFIGPAGKVGLGDLFEGRRQLIVYHHMLKAADPAPCPGCGMIGDQMPHLAHLRARNTSLTFVSRAPFAEIDAFRRRMGWQMPWVETTDEFNMELTGMQNGPGMSVFIRDGDAIFRTYFTTGRGLENIGTVWTLLDLTPLGRQETWEDTPAGVEKSPPYVWWRLHDAYEAEGSPLSAG